MRLSQRSSRPSAFVKVPTVIGWYHADGKPNPKIRPPPDREETGTNRPEKLAAGMIEMTMVANTAETCVRVNVEISCPKPVDAATYSKVPSTNVKRDPLTGTSNRKTARINNNMKLAAATAM